ncbi:MAG TPA: serine/threonine protein kinase [Polyangiaceae bacterium]|nr:serine/threonine protein kinase [Polyangiaceae bacterium]
MKPRFSKSLICCAVLFGTACGPHFQITAPADFVVLDQSVPYDFRATTPDGLVLAVREFDNSKEHGDLGFWVKAIENELRLDKGYALLKTADLKTKAGLGGKALHFGLDRENEAHEYLVVVFVTGHPQGKSRVYLIEAGGAAAQLETSRKAIDQAIADFEAH